MRTHTERLSVVWEQHEIKRETPISVFHELGAKCDLIFENVICPRVLHLLHFVSQRVNCIRRPIQRATTVRLKLLPIVRPSVTSQDIMFGGFTGDAIYIGTRPHFFGCRGELQALLV